MGPRRVSGSRGRIWPRALLMGSGASIPVVEMLKDTLGLDSLLVGFGLDDDQVHSPNEKFEMTCFHQGQRAYVRLLAEIARADDRMIDWSTHYARRAAGMAGSDVSELLALLSRQPSSPSPEEFRTRQIE